MRRWILGKRMTLPTRRSVWQWSLLFISPAFLLFAFSAYGWWLAPHYPNRPNDTVVFRGMIAYACFSPILGFYLAWGFRPWLLKVFVGVCYTVGLLVLNWFLGFYAWDFLQHIAAH
jgi:phosphoglycerol transferase MdoB-like AlkP superfamily enzyme